MTSRYFTGAIISPARDLVVEGSRKEGGVIALPAVIGGRERARSKAGLGLPRTTRGAGRLAGRATPPRLRAFWLVATVLVLLFAVAAAPSPLYGVYRPVAVLGQHADRSVRRLRLFLLVTLLVFGSVSDYLGRRRVILAGLVMTAGACGLFLAAHGVGLLFAARALNGAAVGTASRLGRATTAPRAAGWRPCSRPPPACWAWP